MLNTILHGHPTEKPALLIAHGLFGSARNWGVIGKRLSADRLVIAADMRNHGGSAWAESHSYPDLAEDLADVLRHHPGPADVLGHSMGGKASMVLALSHPGLVRRLVVADIAPVAYTHTQQQQIDAMRRVDLVHVKNRTEAGEQMQAEDPGITAFLLQSLDMEARRWRVNLPVLEREMKTVTGFPEIAGQFGGPTMFLTGENSSYVLPEHRARIKDLFPRARFAKIPGTGHWLHAEKPREFEGAVRAFLDAPLSTSSATPLATPH